MQMLSQAFQIWEGLADGGSFSSRNLIPHPFFMSVMRGRVRVRGQDEEEHTSI